ncbi:MAG: nucleotidyltransferase domain-containing protein [Nanoarchaeota archaeon]
MVQKGDNLELDIVELLLRGPSHVRGIAKALSEPHTTVLRKLNDLTNDNIIESKTEGRNRVFALRDNLICRNFILQAELNKLTKLVSKHPELSIIIDDILKHTDDQMIILFGSYAKGLEKKDSDIDIYVETTNRKTKKTIEELYPRLSVKIGTFEKASPLIREIIKDHVIIKGFEAFYEKQVLG